MLQQFKKTFAQLQKETKTLNSLTLDGRHVEEVGKVPEKAGDVGKILNNIRVSIVFQ